MQGRLAAMRFERHRRARTFDCATTHARLEKGLLMMDILKLSGSLGALRQLALESTCGALTAVTTVSPWPQRAPSASSLRGTDRDLLDAYFDVPARRGVIDCLHHLRELSFNARPAGGEKNHDGNGARGQVLLILEVAIRCDEDFEPCCFGRGDEEAVLKRRPASFEHCFNRVCSEGLA